MAINPIESCERYDVRPGYSPSNTSSKGSNLTQCHLLKFNYSANGSVTSATSKNMAGNSPVMSPYLGYDGLQLFSRLTEKKLYKQTEFVSSFPLAAKIYKASSDEFRLRKKNRSKKNKKSVLTLPNERSVLPQSCTVSDMNDSEYFKREAEDEKKAKKRLPKLKKKVSNRDEFEFYDRDAKYCSQVNIDLDCSSTDIIENFKGDCRRKRTGLYNSKMGNHGEVQPHDVWAVLRNINQFQFNPSPPLSDDSIDSPANSKKNFKKNKRKRASVIETCRTEQYYISSIDVQDKMANSNSCSSLDRITVIDNERELNDMFEDKLKNGFKNRSAIVKNKAEKYAKNKSKSKKSLGGKVGELHSKYNTEQGHLKAIKGGDNKDSVIMGNLCGTRKSNDLVEFVINDDDYVKDTPVATEFDDQLTNYSGRNSNSSTNCRKDNQRVPRPTSPSLLELKPTGPSKIVLSKGQELTLSRRQMPPTGKIHPVTTMASGTLASKLTQMSPTGKLQLVTTMPNVTSASKLTLTEIRRRLANIKFPIVVLGKEQVSGTAVDVLPYQYSQFDGLNEHIWPFMLAWSNKKKDGKNEIKSEIKDCKYSGKKRNILIDRNKRYEEPNYKKPTNYLSLNKQILKPKKPTPVEFSYSLPKKKEFKPSPVNNESHQEQQIVKPKPIRQFRDKLLKLLYKKTSSSSIENDITNTPGQTDVKEYKPKIASKYNKNVATNVDAGVMVEPYVRPIVDKDKDKPKITRREPTPPSKLLPSLIPTHPSKILLPAKPQRGKAKWTSAFIDNVIRKLKTGAYYNNNNTNDFVAGQQRDSKEISIQTTIPVSAQGLTDLTPKITIKRKEESLEFLPGFEDCLPQLEIKSMTRSQIAVKHCVSNVVFQFDVGIPAEQEQMATNFKRSAICIPLAVTESKTKVFKCKTQIINDILPAEICSIIPKVMNRLANADAKVPILQEADMNSNLSTISELSCAENLDMVKVSLSPHIKVSPELIALTTGKFPEKSKQILEKPGFSFRRSVLSFIEGNLQNVMKLLPSLFALDKQFYLVPRPELLLPWKTVKLTPEIIPIPRIKMSTPESTDWCTDLVPYAPKRTNVTSAEQILHKLFDLKQGELFNSIIKLNFKHLPSFLSNTLTFDITLSNVRDIKRTVSVHLVKIEVDPIQNAFTNIFPVKKTHKSGLESSAKCIQYVKNVDYTKTNKARRDSHLPSVGLAKRKRKRYVKLYKKCKSTSHMISAETIRTPLKKINNLDDFFEALGTGKLLSSAFDGNSGRKILASIVELKSWITDISPRQAMLVLLLNNKKDTPNLVRFRPMILQGIAVNRITQAIEMDMEIEVIEREKFSVLPEHDGTCDLFDSKRNDNNLLQELCWIAKTTASDYQKPFDGSSEKLLQDLLEKRKKLNPSYLRVMARYVGLGLLKSIKK